MTRSACWRRTAYGWLGRVRALSFRAFIQVLPALLLTLMLTACDDAPPKAESKDQQSGGTSQSAGSQQTVTPKATEEAKPRVALVMKTLTNPFFVAMEEGARRAEKDFGIELIVRTAAEETSIAQQIDIIDQLARSKDVDAIVVAPGDSVRLIPALKMAADSGIAVVNIDN
ncbi:MAG: substrate-binding domain-containing protein, partial [Rhodospirillales bacterium]